MLYIYRRAASEGARSLAEEIAINCRKISNTSQPHYGQGLREGDRLVCWGETMNPIPGVEVLNGSPVLTKYEEALKLKEANVLTIKVARQKPAQEAVEDFFQLPIAPGAA